MNKNEVCCFSGHRPSDLPWKFKEKGIRFLFFRFRLKTILKKLIRQGYTTFVSGMALGADLILAEEVLALRDKYIDIKLICAVPCYNQYAKWSEDDVTRYKFILNCADEIVYVSETDYYKGCMFERNKYMIENSSAILAVYNGKKYGGTYQTLRMAKAARLKIFTIKP